MHFRTAMGEILGGCSEHRNGNDRNRPVLPNSGQKEFALKVSDTSHRLEVQAFLILERAPGSREFDISVLLRADGQFIGKTSLGTVAEGQQILLSLRWDQPTQRFVASSQAAGGVPILSFIPFASPMAADAIVPPEFSMLKNFVLNSGVSDKTEAHKDKT
jgi:hypothetical protein